MYKTREQLEAMTKEQIDEYGDSLGLNLDRRLKKETLIGQVLVRTDAMKVAHAVKDEPVVEELPPEEEYVDEYDTSEKPGFAHYLNWGSLAAIVVLVGLGLYLALQ